MRQQIDCAVLILAAHQAWLPQVLSELEPALNRIKIHALEWEAGHDLDLELSLDRPSAVSLPYETLAQASIGLRRYDVVLLPVSMETIAWTRQALAAIPRGPFIPLVGVLKEMRSAAIQDLLEMGLTDFVRLPVCTDEFRARLLHSVTSVPRPGSLREPSLNYGQKIAIARGVLPIMGEATLRDWLNMTRRKNPGLTTLSTEQIQKILAGQLPLGPESEKDRQERLKLERTERIKQVEKQDELEIDACSASIEQTSEQAGKGHDKPRHLKVVKTKLIEEFERAYLIEAMDRNKGNIANAARYSGKHRRAFWALLRKYDIEAEDFRT
jgi:CheY-like chemotaxis protein